MKYIVILVTLFCWHNCLKAQQWTALQLKEANTAADEYILTDTERAVIKYINLCRLYPVAFAELELKDYKGLPNIEDNNFAAYKETLVKELATKQPVAALQFDELVYDDAKCYGNEISKNKRKPHERIDCIKRNYAECIYYGSGEAKHIAMQWLIDSGVTSLGHRKTCLSPLYRKAGIKVNTHFEYGHCAVLELTK